MFSYHKVISGRRYFINYIAISINNYYIQFFYYKESNTIDCDTFGSVENNEVNDLETTDIIDLSDKKETKNVYLRIFFIILYSVIFILNCDFYKIDKTL